MDIIKNKTLDRIIYSATNEFIKQGFKDASLRKITEKAGVTTGALYGYFKDKEALFTAIVSPVVTEFKGMFIKSQVEFYKLSLDKKKDIIFSYSGDELRVFVGFIYDNYTIFKLLVCSAEGTIYSNFIHYFVDIEVEYIFKFIQELNIEKADNISLTENLVHIIVSSYFYSIFEVIEHDMSREEAELYIDNIKLFFTAGWSKLLNV